MPRQWERPKESCITMAKRRENAGPAQGAEGLRDGQCKVELPKILDKARREANSCLSSEDESAVKGAYEEWDAFWEMGAKADAVQSRER